MAPRTAAASPASARSSCLLLVVSCLLAGCLCAQAAVDVTELHDELKELRAQSSNGILTFSSDNMFSKFAAGRQRPYNLYVFLTAKQVLDNKVLNIQGLFKEFTLAAKAVKAGPDADSNFFVEAWFEETPEVFKAVKCQQVPFIFRISGTSKLSLTPLAAADKMTLETFPHKFPWTAEDMLGYFAKSGLTFAAVDRPSIYKTRWFPFMVGAAVAVTLSALWGIWKSGILHHPLPWAMLSLAVFWFSVSGGMFNIIRGMPLFIRDRNGKLQFFLKSKNGQLGAEGFIMGSGYILFSSAIAMMTYAVPRVRNGYARTLLSYAMVAAAAFVLQKLFVAFQAKSNYRITSYLLR